MSFLHPQSCECASSELDLFSVPPTQTSLESGQWLQYKPVSSLTDDSPVEFTVTVQAEFYIDLSQTMLYLRAAIMKPDGGAFKEVNQIAPVNNWSHSLCTQVDVFLNQKLVSPPSNTYAYRAYIETLLNYNSEAKRTHLTCGLWFADSPGSFEEANANNKGFEARRSLTAKSKTVDLLGYLHGDVFNQEKYLLNGTELRVRLVRSRDGFSLMAVPKLPHFKVHIAEAGILVWRVSSTLYTVGTCKALNVSPTKYPITRVEVKTLTIPTGVQGKSLDNVFTGQLPKRFIVGFASNAAFNGNAPKNPFSYQFYAMNNFSLYVDGEQVPSKPLQPDFSNGKYVVSYHTLISGMAIHFMNEASDITREAFPKGYNLMAFDLTPSLSTHMTSYWNLTRHGSLSIEVSFTRALTKTVDCIVYGVFANIITIDKDRNVVTDYGS